VKWAEGVREEEEVATRREMLLFSCCLAAGGMSRVEDRAVTSLLDVAPPESDSGERAGHGKGMLSVLQRRSIAWWCQKRQI
jgi:hypothetical protein